MFETELIDNEVAWQYYYDSDMNNLDYEEPARESVSNKQGLDEQFEDYQKIYDETVNRQDEERSDKKWEKDKSR